jgi:hypothetical protein
MLRWRNYWATLKTAAKDEAAHLLDIYILASVRSPPFDSLFHMTLSTAACGLTRLPGSPSMSSLSVSAN